MRDLGKVLDDIRKAGDKLVVVTGAGVTKSVRLGNPNWWQLVDQGLQAHFAEDLVEDATLEELLIEADRVQGEAGKLPSAWWTPLFSGIHGNVGNTDLIQALAELDVPVVTLNYDELFTIVSGWPARVPAELHPLSSGVKPALTPEKGSVMHLHGWHEQPNQVVLGSVSYQRFTRALRTQTALRAWLLDRHILFVGCGPDTTADYNLGPLIRFLEHVLSGQGGPHWLLAVARELTGCTSRLIEPVIVADHADALTFIRCLAKGSPATAPLPNVPIPHPPAAWLGTPPVQSTMTSDKWDLQVVRFAGMCIELTRKLEAGERGADVAEAVLCAPRWFRTFGVADGLLNTFEAADWRVASLAFAEVALDGQRADVARDFLVRVNADASVPPTLKKLEQAVGTHLGGLVARRVVGTRSAPTPDPRLPRALSALRGRLFRRLEILSLAWWEDQKAGGGDWSALLADFEAHGDKVGELLALFGAVRALLAGRAPYRSGNGVRPPWLEEAIVLATRARLLVRRLRHPVAPWVDILEGDVLARGLLAAPQALRHYEAALSAFRFNKDDAGEREARASIARLHLFAARATKVGARSRRKGATGEPFGPLHWDEVTSGIHHLEEADFSRGASGRWARGPAAVWRDKSVKELKAMLA